jgi:HSP20 family molecular chaperone IbpA
VKAGFNNGILTISLAKAAGSDSVAQQVPVD